VEAPFERSGLYGERAELYDRIYHWKDYAGEAAKLRDLLRAEGIHDGARLVDAACGTGSHLAHFREWFDVRGFDQSEELLGYARRKLPGVRLDRGDLVDFELEPPADVITCLFSAIGCVFPVERLRAAARCFARGLLPGGVALIEPWVTPEVFREGTVGFHTAEGSLPKLVRMATTIREGQRTVVDFHWLVGHPDRVDHLTERHVLWMYTRTELVGAFEAAGLETRWDDPGPMGRGLVVARKREREG
jgi:SAM-dependent methyltransferase